MEEVENKAPGSAEAQPDFLTTSVTLQSGEQITMRPMRPDDVAQFTEYLTGLLPPSRRRFGPHLHDQATAEAICAALDPNDILRMIATVPHNGGERIISYILLKHGVLDGDQKRYEALGIPLHPDTDSTLAPSVADDYQNQGVGSLMMGHLIQSAKKLGRQRIVLWCGVAEANSRAVHFYTKWGFRKVGEFDTGENNYDMILDL